MANVRLRTNLILDGKFHVRGSVLDEALIPKHLRDSDHVDYDLESREGKVLLLRDLSFQNLPRPMSDGVLTTFPCHLTAGELLDLAQVPESKRLELVEGLDYRAQWTFEEAEALRKAQEDIYANAKQLEAEPESVPTGVAPWRNR